MNHQYTFRYIVLRSIALRNMIKNSDKVQPRINCKSQINAGSTKGTGLNSDAAALNGENTVLDIQYGIECTVSKG